MKSLRSEKSSEKNYVFRENLGMTPPLIGPWTVQAGGDHDLDHDLPFTVNPKHSQSMLNTLLSLRVQ